MTVSEAIAHYVSTIYLDFIEWHTDETRDDLLSFAWSNEVENPELFVDAMRVLFDNGQGVSRTVVFDIH